MEKYFFVFWNESFWSNSINQSHGEKSFKTTIIWRAKLQYECLSISITCFPIRYRVVLSRIEKTNHSEFYNNENQLGNVFKQLQEVDSNLINFKTTLNNSTLKISEFLHPKNCRFKFGCEASTVMGSLCARLIRFQ
jgi:hypothetical protein